MHHTNQQHVIPPKSVSELADASDVVITSVGDNEFLVYDSGSSSWVNQTGSEAGIVLADGSVPLTSDWDAGSHQIRSETFFADVATGTAPLQVTSTTKVANLNAEQVDGADLNDSGTTTSDLWSASKIQTEIGDSGLPRGYIDGFEIRQSSSGGVNYVEVYVGECRSIDDSLNVELTAKIEKDINSAFAEGNQNGGLLDGGYSDAIANEWYAVHVLRKDSDGTIDVGISTDSNGGNVAPTGWTWVRRVGWIRTDGSSPPVALSLTNTGDLFYWGHYHESANTTVSSGSNTVTLSHSPPGNVNKTSPQEVYIFVEVEHASAQASLYIYGSGGDSGGDASGSQPVSLLTPSGGGKAAGFVAAMTADGGVAVESSHGSVTFKAWVIGWRDDRDKDKFES